MNTEPLSNQAEAIDPSEITSVPDSPSPEEVKLEKVRELLFGNQARSIEQRFTVLEAELVALKTDFESRLEHLEDIVTKGFDSITQQIQAERAERQGAIASETEALRQNILDQAQQCTAALNQTAQDLLREINEESQRRQQQNRGQNARLSALFGELSEHPNDE